MFQQFLVNAHRMNESSRLHYVRTRQKELRAEIEIYKGRTEAILRGEIDRAKSGKKIVLPSFFTGGARYMFKIIKTQY